MKLKNTAHQGPGTLYTYLAQDIELTSPQNMLFT